jgi:hypothetical protein
MKDIARLEACLQATILPKERTFTIAYFERNLIKKIFLNWSSSLSKMENHTA